MVTPPNYERFLRPDVAESIANWYAQLTELMGKPEMRDEIFRLVDSVQPEIKGSLDQGELESSLIEWFSSRKFSHYNDPAEAKAVHDDLVESESFEGITTSESQQRIDQIVARSRDPLDLQKKLGQLDAIPEYSRGSPAQLCYAQRVKKGHTDS